MLNPTVEANWRSFNITFVNVFFWGEGGIETRSVVPWGSPVPSRLQMPWGREAVLDRGAYQEREPLDDRRLQRDPWPDRRPGHCLRRIKCPTQAGFCLWLDGSICCSTCAKLDFIAPVDGKPF